VNKPRCRIRSGVVFELFMIVRPVEWLVRAALVRSAALPFAQQQSCRAGRPTD
jgi:hypothetical protein